MAGIRIVIVDDHPIVRNGLSSLIQNEADIVLCGEAGSVREALAVVGQANPDVVIVDISLEDGNGLELTKDLSSRYPNLRILVLSMYKETLYAERCIRAGAYGYIMKRDADLKIVEAIRKVVGGNIYLSDEMSSRLLLKLIQRSPAALDDFSAESLSDRELEVLELLGVGESAGEIAEKLNLSINTVNGYKSSIREKLKLKSGSELLQFAIQWCQKDI